ncbi:MAG TPA: response regulator [Acidobacteriaceae bacterium]|jgi:CheY-like chemotaxis protein|nr:response regulator [Acidobacteriaceae bacterium]
MTAQRIQVLVVEDDAVARDIYRKLLCAWGFEPRLARNGHETLIEIYRWKPNVVSFDLEMPGM